MHRLIHRRLLLPLFEGLLKRRRTFRYWSELERSQWQSPDQLAGRQMDALQRLLLHAQRHCPYYRDAWRELGLDPARVHDLDDFRAWPLIDRGAILANRAAMRCALPGTRLISKSTGGSSGEPLHFDLNTDSNDRRVAASFRGYGWAGAGPGSKLLYLWGGAMGPQPRLKAWKELLHHRLYRRKMLSSFDLTEASVPRFLAEHNRYRPDALVAYTNPLYEFARMLEERGAKPFSPQSIIVGAEKLYPFQRTLIERVFNAPVFETYGSREFMLIGAECERHAGLHLTTEHLLVEVLDDNGQPAVDGEEGNVVITDLYNYGMPFIRYVNGDRAIAGASQCPCGRALPLLRGVAGRTLDIITTPDGRRVAGEFFPHMMKDFSAVRRFQVVQDAPDHLEVRVVASPAWTAADAAAVRRLIQNAIGDETRLDLVTVDDIPLTKAGKQRVVVNRCHSAEQQSVAGGAHAR